MLPFYWMQSLAVGQRNVSLTVHMQELEFITVLRSMEKQL